MKLYCSLTSPFARNVRLVMAHHNLTEAVEVVITSPFDDEAKLREKNPLCKIPALELDNGEMIYDSSVIVDYFDQLGEGDGLFESDDIAPYRIRTIYSLADGVLDSAISCVLEGRRVAEDRSAHWLERWQQNILDGIVEMERMLPEIRKTTLMPRYSFVTTADFISFRLPHVNWKEAAPSLAAWINDELKQDHFVETDPRLAE